MAHNTNSNAQRLANLVALTPDTTQQWGLADIEHLQKSPRNPVCNAPRSFRRAAFAELFDTVAIAPGKSFQISDSYSADGK